MTPDEFMESALDGVGAFDESNDEARDRAYVRTCLEVLLESERKQARAPFLALADELDEVARQHDDAEPVKMDDLLRMITAARVTRHAADRIRHAADDR